MASSPIGSSASSSRPSQMVASPMSTEDHTKPSTSRRITTPLQRALGEYQDDADSLGYQPSASEDDELRHSDSGASSSFPSQKKKQSSSSTPQIQQGSATGKRSGLSTPHGPGSSASPSLQSIRAQLSSGNASANSSRSNLPLQNKTSLYRRQASAASSAGDASEDGITPLKGAQDLSRAKSVSSVSSVNSTSSMEAVPFRAAPLGNVRLGFGGYARGLGRGRDRAQMSDRYHAQPTTKPNQEEEDANLLVDGQMANEKRETPTVEALDVAYSKDARSRILPKGPSDDWLYRNAPGMGSRPRMQHHTVAVPGRSPRPSIPTSFDPDAPDEDVESGTSLWRTNKPSIRNKLAKRAGKLGLKPLTSVSSPERMIGLYTNNLNVQSESHGDGQSSIPGQLTPSVRLSPEGNIRTRPHLTSSVSPTTFADIDFTKNTSSMTNAPLVVPKHPPGPPGSGPPPSPGLVGLATYPFQHALSTEGTQDNHSSSIVPSNESEGPHETFAGDPPHHPIASPEPRHTGPSSLAYSALLGTSTRSPVGVRTSSPSKQTISPSTPPLTPAQKIQLDAQAGKAVLPSEPSGSSPGPNPQDIKQQSPMETGIGQTQAPKSSRTSAQRFSGGNQTLRNNEMKQKRPSLLRALTSESGLNLKGNMSSKDSRRMRRESGSARSSSSSNLEGLTSSMYKLETSGSPSSPPSRPSRSLMKHPSVQVLRDEPGPQGSRNDGLRAPAFSRDLSTLHSTPRRGSQEIQGSSFQSRINITSSTTPSDLPSQAATISSSASASPRGSPVANDLPLHALSHLPSNKLSVQPLGFSGDQDDLSEAKQTSDAPSMPCSSPERQSNSSPQQSSEQTRSPETVKTIVKQPDGSSASRTARLRDDFHFGELLGEGSYSTVIEAWDLLSLRERGLKIPEELTGNKNNALAAFAGKTGERREQLELLKDAKVYAIKILDKVHILKQKKQKYVGVEKEALSRLTRHPGVITLYWTFQDQESLCEWKSMPPRCTLTRRRKILFWS